MTEPELNLPDPDFEPEPQAEPEGKWVPTPRDLVWFQGITDEIPVPPHLSPNATYFGLDTGSRDVFVHSTSLDLEMLKLAEAYGMDCALFANPSKATPTDEAFVTIDYLERRQPLIFRDYGLHEIRQRVRATFARTRKK